jgi:hypothetical protein
MDYGYPFAIFKFFYILTLVENWVPIYMIIVITSIPNSKLISLFTFSPSYLVFVSHKTMAKRKRTEKTMAKRKRTNNDNYKILHRKLKIEQHERH